MSMCERNEMLADLKRSGIDINNTSREDIIRQAMSEHGIPLNEILENLERDTVLFAVHEAMVEYNSIVFEDDDDTEDEDIVSCVVCGEAESDCDCDCIDEEEVHITDIVLDEKGRVASHVADGVLIVYGYDDRDNVISETYPSGEVFRREYDIHNKLIKEFVELEDGSIFIVYEYNDNNKRFKAINPDGSISTCIH